jgi:hypothetical protein
LRRLECERDNVRSVFYAVLEGPLNPDSPQFRPYDPVNPRSLRYRIFCTQTPRSDEDWFEAEFREINETTVQCVVLNANENPNYLRKGIPESVFKHMSVWSGKTIVSSSNKHQSPWDVYRNQNAERVWRRLQSARHAVYDEATDRFAYIP